MVYFKGSELPLNRQAEGGPCLVPLTATSWFPSSTFLNAWPLHDCLLSTAITVLKNFVDEVVGHHDPIILTCHFNPKDISTVTLGKLDSVKKKKPKQNNCESEKLYNIKTLHWMAIFKTVKTDFGKIESCQNNTTPKEALSFPEKRASMRLH